MRWNWTQVGWPRFSYDGKAMATLEQQFLLAAGEVAGTIRHIDASTQEQVRIDILSDEAVQTSRIEGEFLDRASVQSSLCRQFGLAAPTTATGPREHGIAMMTADVYRNFHTALDDATLFRWHSMLMAGSHLEAIGAYRRHVEAMQIVSGSIDRPVIHFEAPPSARVPHEMAVFNTWFNRTLPGHADALPTLTRAGLSHVHFESIHPFEDGNGRIGRALAEKAIAQGIGHPSLIALSQAIERKRAAYYEHLERTQGGLDVTEWLVYFGRTILEAQQLTLDKVTFIIAKARFYERFTGQFSPRQDKVVARLFREGAGGFMGGLSAENYIAMTQVSPATATRDLQDLVARGALLRSGERRYARYRLNLPDRG